MKVSDVIAKLQEYDGNEELWFLSCCYPNTKHITIERDYDGDLTIDGKRGSYVLGDDTP